MPIDPHKTMLTRITCARHVTPYLRAEIEALGHEIQEEDASGVSIGASLIDCLPLNLRLRTANQVLWLLSRFRCPSPKALYTEAAAYPWEELIPNDSYVSVTSNVDNPKIDNSLYPTRVLKDAIVDRIAKRTGARPDSGPDKSKNVVHLFWKGDRAWVYLNTSGQLLGDRGYRKLPHHAPMRETLAAAVLMAAGYDGFTPLINPMCGSGTLAIEAALIATGRAPGLLRSNYGFLHCALDLADAWGEARRGSQISARKPPPIIASDNDPVAIDAARRNARVAGVEQLIEFVECDFADTPIPDGDGHVVLNPEYGERMGETEALGAEYKRIGDFFKQRCPGKHGHVFTGSRELSKRIGLRPSRRHPFFNAQIECRLLSYELYAGGKPA
jgi:23S rRNA G2445 N2-methylase RlmL